MHALPVSLFSLLLLAPIADGWLGVYLDSEREQAVVTEVIPDSPAAKAGLQAGDLLVAVGDKATATREEFVAAIRAGKAGDRVSITLRRDDKESIVVVKLGERPEAVASAEPAPPARPVRTKPSAPAAESAPSKPVAAPAAPPKRAYLGLSVRESERGVVVERVLPDGPAKALAAEEGTLLTNLGEHAVKTLDDLDRFLQGARPGQKVALGLRDGNGVRSVTIALGERPGTELRPRTEARSQEGAATPPIATAPIAVAPSRVEPSRPTGRELKPALDTKPTVVKETIDLEVELAALRAELADLRRQLEELRKGKGRE